MSVRVLLVSLILFLAACVPGHAFPALDHGPTHESLISSVVGMMAPGEPLGIQCTGFFISETEVLTAAHCVQRTRVVRHEVIPGVFVSQVETSTESPVGDEHRVVLRSHYRRSPLLLERTIFIVSAYDAVRDLALLQVKEGEDLPSHGVARVYSGHPPIVGDPVMAVGHPVGMMYNVTTGIISREMGNMIPLRDSPVLYVYSSALIYRGNSGGPLFNAHGEVLGVASWMANNQPHLGGWVSYVDVRDFLEGT